MSDWMFGVLGTVQVDHRGVAYKVPAGRQQAVLATLALRVNEVVTASLLLEQVWEGQADRSVLNVCMMRLRRTLRDPDQEVLRSERDGYRLAVDHADVDLHRFRALTREAGTAAECGDDERERRLLQEALALWRGAPFDGIESTPIQSELVPILVEEQLTTVERRIDADLRHGIHRELVSELRELVATHPYRERYWQQLMLALHRSGRQSDALEAFRTVRETLAEELGIEPGTELRALQQRILDDDPDLFLHAERARTEQDAPAYVPLLPAQLPPLASGFTGRGDELRRLHDLYDQPSDASRIIAITGLPGVGKTSLGLRWAVERIAEFPDGQLYVDLGGHSDHSPVCPVEALSAFLRAMGVASDEIPADPEAAASMYRSIMARRRVLVMLDNAGDPMQVRPLLPGGSGSLVIVTSRDRLSGLVAQDGAHELIVNTLTDGEAETLLANIVGCERLGADPDAGVELARACGNLPLALRVAGANIASSTERTVAEHATELVRDDRLGALAVTGDEQMAVRPAFHTSYAHLPVAAQTMFCVLGLFPGREITTDTAAVLTDTTPHEASHTLGQLRTAHLISPLPGSRFVFHDLLRLFAGELAYEELSAEHRRAAVHRLYVYYAHAVEQAAQRLYPQAARIGLSSDMPSVTVAFAEGGQAMGWLEAHQQNLVAAVTAAQTHDELLEGCRIVSGLRGYLMMKQDLVDWLTIGRAGLAAARSLDDPGAEASARLGLANLHEHRFEARAAIAHYQRALALSRRAAWIDGEAAALNNLAIAQRLQGNLQVAVGHLRRAYVLNQRSGWVAGQAMNLNNLGGFEMEMGLTSKAAEHLRQARRLHRRAGSGPGEAHSLSALGEVHTATGEYERAKELLEAALAMQESLDDRTQLPLTTGYLAYVHLRLNECSRAAELASRAVDLAGESGHEAAGIAVRVLAAIDQAQERYNRALEGYQHAIRLARATGGVMYVHPATLTDIARLYRDLGRSGAARHHAERAMAIARRAGFAGLVAEAEEVRAEVLSACHRRLSR